MTVTEYLEEELRKIDLEISHYEHSLKHDKEKLDYFTNVKQHLQSSLKNFDREEAMDNILNLEKKVSLAVNFPTMQDLY